MNQQVSVTAPINSLLGDLQDIAATLAAVTAPVVLDEPEMTEGFPTEAWNHIKRVTALSTGIICEITQPELDRLIFGYTLRGMLITHYQTSLGAILYRRPDGSVVAMSVRGRCFCNRDIRPIRSATLYIQQVGRANRVRPTAESIQWSNEWSLPLLTREGGAGEGPAAYTAAMLAEFFAVPLNIGGPVNTALLTDGVNTDTAQ